MGKKNGRESDEDLEISSKKVKKKTTKVNFTLEENQENDGTGGRMRNNGARNRDTLKSMSTPTIRLSSDNTDGITGVCGALGSLVVLRILLLDIGASLGDVITDFAQAWNLLNKEVVADSERTSIRTYGWVVLAVNWLPGVVAAIHLIQFYRFGFMNAPKEIRQQQIKKLLKMALVCFLFYPVLPTVGYIFMLLNLGNNKEPEKLALMDNISQITHGIAGCIEAPVQLCITTYLILIGLLEVPLYVFVEMKTDAQGNKYPVPDIPMLSMLFSFLNMLTCAAKINIFNVFIVQIRKVDDFKRYASLSAGYMPMFLHSILYRVLAYAIFLVFLSFWAFIPIGFILFSNVCIGYIFYGHTALEGHLRKAHKNFVARNEKMGLANAHQALGNTPVWLNSFLGLFIPSCFSTGPLPAFVDSLSPEDYKKVLKQQSLHQKSVLKYQVLLATWTILITTGVTFYLVNYGGLKYTSNSLSHTEFLCCCILLGIQSMISFVFVYEVDILRRFDSLVIKDKQKSMFIKILISLTCCAVVIILPFAAFYSSSKISHPNVYIISQVNSKEGNTTTLELGKGELINVNFDSFPLNKNSTDCSVFKMDNPTMSLKDKILIVDEKCTETNFRDDLNKSGLEAKLDGISGLLVLNSEQSTSMPWKYSHLLQVEKFPVVLINYYDKERIGKLAGSFIQLSSKDITESLDNNSSLFYQKNCTNLFRPRIKVNLEDRKDFYIGCDGNIKKVVNILLKCTDKGHACPEVDRFEKHLKIDDPFGKCNKIEGKDVETGLYPGMTCAYLPGNFTDSFHLNNPQRCKFENRTYEYKKSCGKIIADEQNWGDWITEDKCFYNHDGKKIRFSRPNTNCLLKEIQFFDDRNCDEMKLPDTELQDCPFPHK